MAATRPMRVPERVPDGVYPFRVPPVQHFGVGGGSAMDTAKGVSLRTANPGPLQQYFGVELVPATGLPAIQVPTTAGTGSEVTPNAIFDDPERRLKAGIVSHRLFAPPPLLDP